MKKIFRKLHLWLSVPFGLIIAVVCITGAALVFETEFMQICYPERYYVENVGEMPLPVEVLLEKVGRTLPDSVTVTAVNISSNPREAYQLSLSQPRRASVYVDQYTGEVKWHYKRARFFNVMFRMHRWLLDSARPDGGIFWGKVIVGVSTIMFIIALITGIVIWVPKTMKALRRSLKISVRKGLKRFWYDLHIAGGMYAVILLLAMSLTGLTWSFSWYRNGFYKVFGVETQQGGGHGAPQQPRASAANVNQQAQTPEGRQSREGGERSAERPRDAKHGESPEVGRSGRGERPQADGELRNGEWGCRTTQTAGERAPENTSSPANETFVEEHIPEINRFAYWQQVYEQLAMENPENSQISVSDGSAGVSFNRWGNQRASDRYTFDTATGAITGTTLYKDQERSGKIRGWIYTVHVGSWGGYFSRILTVLASLLGASLPLTGYYLWIKRGINQRRAKKRKLEGNCV